MYSVADLLRESGVQRGYSTWFTHCDLEMGVQFDDHLEYFDPEVIGWEDKGNIPYVYIPELSIPPYDLWRDSDAVAVFNLAMNQGYIKYNGQVIVFHDLTMLDPGAIVFLIEIYAGGDTLVQGEDFTFYQIIGGGEEDVIVKVGNGSWDLVKGAAKGAEELITAINKF